MERVPCSVHALEDGAEGLAGGRPGPALLAEAEVREGRADVADHRAAKGVFWVICRDRAGLSERGVGRLGGGDGRADVVECPGVGRIGEHGQGADRVGGRHAVDGALGANGHFWGCVCFSL